MCRLLIGTGAGAARYGLHYLHAPKEAVGNALVHASGAFLMPANLFVGRTLGIGDVVGSEVGWY